MRLTIHQPEFLPWLGFFHKAGMADTLMLLDDVQFRKNYFQNRNRVLTANGPAWITVPVEHDSTTRIDEVRVAQVNNPRWRQRLLSTIGQAYGKAPHFKPLFAELSRIIETPGERLVDFSVPLLRWMLERFDLAPKVLHSSAFGVKTQESRRILDLCRAAGADTYVSGISGREYLDLDSFREAGITVEFQEFRHPIYEQLRPGFTPLISAVEALFLFGPEAGRTLKSDWPSRLETVFT